MRIYYWIWGDPSSKIELQPYCGGTTVVYDLISLEKLANHFTKIEKDNEHGMVK